MTLATLLYLVSAVLFALAAAVVFGADLGDHPGAFVPLGLTTFALAHAAPAVVANR